MNQKSELDQAISLLRIFVSHSHQQIPERYVRKAGDFLAKYPMRNFITPSSSIATILELCRALNHWKCDGGPVEDVVRALDAFMLLDR